MKLLQPLELTADGPVTATHYRLGFDSFAEALLAGGIVAQTAADLQEFADRGHNPPDVFAYGTTAETYQQLGGQVYRRAVLARGVKLGDIDAYLEADASVRLTQAATWGSRRMTGVANTPEASAPTPAIAAVYGAAIMFERAIRNTRLTLGRVTTAEFRDLQTGRASRLPAGVVGRTFDEKGRLVLLASAIYNPERDGPYLGLGGYNKINVNSYDR